VLIETTGQDHSAPLQEATREFTRRYEQHAYLVYNLALRIACEQPVAIAAAERAFLEHALEPASQDTLADAAVAAALASARRRPQPSGAGAAAEQALLSAVAKLVPADRAALALATLRGTPADDAVFERLAAALGVPAYAARAACEDWLWAVPPGRLWEAMYPKFYRVAEVALGADARDDEQPTQVLRAPARRRRIGRRLRFGIALLLPAVVTAGAIALPSVRDGDPPREPTFADVQAATTPAPPATSVPPPVGGGAEAESGGDEDDQVRPRRKPLTPRELDQLRRRELRMLELYTKRETDRRLSATERNFAARQVSLLRDLARRRAEADRRERELARAERRQARRERELARERRRAREDGDDPQPVQREPRRSPATAPAPAPEETAPRESEETQDCLYNPDDGTYICQE